jgi:putative peptide maturation dehydrogenase
VVPVPVVPPGRRAARIVVTPRVRRARCLFLTFTDTPTLDLAALLRGDVRMGVAAQAIALSVLRGQAYSLRDDDLQLLASVEATGWTDADAWDEARVAQLVERGLLVSDAEDGEAAELRRREESITASNWQPYGLLLHALTRWRGVGEEDVPVDSAILDATLDEFIERHGAPPPVLHHRAGDQIELPFDEGSPLAEVLVRRRTTRVFDRDRTMELGDLSALLRWTFGAHGYARAHDDFVGVAKTSPSAGGLHPVEAYPILLRVDGAGPGLYHYDAGRHALTELRRLDVAEAEQLAVRSGAGQPWLRDAAAIVLLTARFERTFWKYRGNDRAFTALLMDAAHLSQTFQLLATERGIGAMVTAAVNAAEVDEELGIDGYAEGALALLACGPAAEGPSPLQPEFKPFVPRETEM